MNSWIVIPVKHPAACKTRLATVLDEQGRQALVAQMLLRSFSAACAVVGRDRVRLLGPGRHGLPREVGLLHDAGRGLNDALSSARDAALRARITRLLFLSADLPGVEPDDVAALLDLPPDAVAAASDRSGLGTNALSIPLPGAGQFHFRYGCGSFAAHRREAAELELQFLTVARPGLAFDVDLPEDLDHWLAVKADRSPKLSAGR